MKNLSNILLIEDFEEIRNWLAGLLRETFEVKTISEAATVAQALAHIKTQVFDLIVIDLNLPDGSGIDILRKVKSLGLSAHCVVATAYDDDGHLLTALSAGADGYLLKDQTGEQLMHDLHGILDGAPPLSPPIARRIMKLARQAPAALLSTPLSVREEEVLTFIAKGLNRKEIGKLMGVSIHTVASHVGAIYSKLDISSRAEATLEALRRGLISS
jgi:DNA-binding NarL/FixJ family response regulator